jgi:hypothetical protein
MVLQARLMTDTDLGSFLHWSFQNEIVLFQGLEVTSIWTWFLASILTAVLCLFERSVSRLNIRPIDYISFQGSSRSSWTRKTRRCPHPIRHDGREHFAEHCSIGWLQLSACETKCWNSIFHADAHYPQVIHAHRNVFQYWVRLLPLSLKFPYNDSSYGQLDHRHCKFKPVVKLCYVLNTDVRRAALLQGSLSSNC